MSSNTLFFEDIPLGQIITTNTMEPFPKKPDNNAVGTEAYKYTIQINQDEGEPDTFIPGYKGLIPACAYHMPRSSSRFDNPRVFLPLKKQGDIIEANDLNKLYDRINLFLYAWNAEINDIYGMGITRKLRSPAAKNYMKLINSDKTINGEQPILDGKDGALDIKILNKMYFQMYKAESEDEILAKFQEIENLTATDIENDNKWLSHPLGSALPYGIPLMREQFGIESNPIGALGSSEDINPLINFTIEDKNYTSYRPHSLTNYLYHFGRCSSKTAYLEYGYTVDGVDHFFFVIARQPNGDATYWDISTDSVTYNSVTMSEDLNEIIYTFRDYNEDPLNPKLWYMGIKLFTRPLESNFDGLTSDGSKSVLDYSGTSILYDENDPRYKRGKYPIIKAQEWKNARLTIKTLLDRILGISILEFNGKTDKITEIEINSFYAMQDGSGSTDPLDKDNPETALLNYQAVPGAIIKVEFYNTLIEAYRLMVNSCICNTDCYCNINCICNVNCGCNYY